MNERFLVSELADSLNITIGEDSVLTMTVAGTAETPPFGDVNFTPGIVLDSIPLISGTYLEMYIPLQDPLESVFLAYGIFDEGSFNYTFDVNAQTVPQITLTLPDITTPTGEQCVITYEGRPGKQSYDLTNCTIGVKGSETILDSLSAILEIDSSLPPGTQLGEASFHINSQLGFKVFEGYLYNYVRALEGTISTIDIDYPLDLDQAVQLTQASLQVEVENETGFYAEFHGDIRALNHNTGEERMIPVLDDEGNFFEVLPATDAGPVTTEFEFTNRVSELLQIMPHEVQVMNSYLLINGGSYGMPGFVDQKDIIFCSYRFDAPFQFTLFDHVIELNEPIEVEISPENQSTIQDILQEANLAVEVVNTIPVGGSARVYVSSNEDIDTSDSASYDFSREFNLHSSEYSGEGVGPEGQQLIFLSLNKGEIDVFANPYVYLLWTFNLDSSEGPITIHASPEDYLQVRSILSATIQVEVDL
ncbi:MAG: hypothetical protein ACP5F3_04485 [Candidatus Syntrophosphaera sp.]